MEVLYDYLSIFFFVRAFFFTFLCMDMGGQQFFSAFRDEMDDGTWDGAGAFVRCIGEFLGGMIEEV